MKQVNVLGTVYTVDEVKKSEDAQLFNMDGYCDTSIKKCVVDNMQETEEKSKANLPEYKKSVIRHELIHAFLYESGLDSCCYWAKEEALVDWLAIQFPKLQKAFEEAGCL